MRSTLVLGVPVVAGLLALATPAGACSCLRRDGPASFSIESGGLLPPDAGAIVYHGSREWLVACTVPECGNRTVEAPPDRASFSLRSATGAVPFTVEPIEVEVLPGFRTVRELVLRAPDLHAAERYVAEGPDARIVFSVGAGPIAPSLAEARLLVDEPRHGGLTVGHPAFCQVTLGAATRSFTVELPPAIEQYRQALRYQSLVDDQPWVERHHECDPIAPWASWVGRGRERVYAGCELPHPDVWPGLAVGAHVLRVKLSVPGTAIAAEVSAAFELACPPPPESQPPPAVRPSPPPTAIPPAQVGCAGCVLGSRPDAHRPAACLVLLLALARGMARRAAHGSRARWRTLLRSFR